MTLTEPDVTGRTPLILVAGIGNAWLRDDGFGSGGLDLAYEVMRGYHGLVLVDVSQQGGKPGTLYVMEPDPEEIEGGIEDGEVINPHGMDPKTVLRFVKAVGGWPGKVVIVACEPGNVEEMGMGLTDEVSAAIDGAVKLVLEQVEELRCTSSP